MPSPVENVTVCIIERFRRAGRRPTARSGIEDVVILERAGSIGGTWRANTCRLRRDIPSHLTPSRLR